MAVRPSATEARLQEIMRVVLKLPADADVSNVEQPLVGSWDSLAHVTLMLAIESEFGIAIDLADQLELTSYAAILQYLEEQGA
jgi:acyl carrier protein